MKQMNVPRGTARANRRHGYADPFFFERVNRPGYTNGKHIYDEDGCCVNCNFDGAEWHWWRHNTYEGKASDSRPPECNGRI